MTVGKGSVARAAKAAPASQKETVKRASAVHKTAESAVSAKTVEITAPADEVMARIIYETNKGMLERDAEPNENFSVGDSMPIYYF